MAAIMLENDPVPLVEKKPQGNPDGVGEENVEAESKSIRTIEELPKQPR
jgi:hypothetical protein